MEKEEKYEIDDQRANEDIILCRHMHPWIFAKTGMIAVLLALIVASAFFIWHLSTISFVLLGLMIIIVVIYGLISSFQYKNTVFILTNLRVININQVSLINRKVQEMELGNIYNLQYNIKGLMKSLLNFGDVEITTLGNDENSIIVSNIENPHFVYEKISKTKEKITGSRAEADRMMIR